MWSLLDSRIAGSRYEFYDFHKGSLAGLLPASHLLTALVACAIGIPYFMWSRRVRATFVHSHILPRRLKFLWLNAFAAPEVIVLIGGIVFLGLGTGLFRSSTATKENTIEEMVTEQLKVPLTRLVPEVQVRPGPNPAPEETLVRPEAGRWFGAIQGGEFSPIHVEFEIAEDRRSVQALMLTGPKMSAAWLPGTFFFDEQKIGAARFTAARGESQVTVTFLSENEARGQAKVTMEILKKPSLETVKALVSGDFTIKPRHLWGGVLDGGVNPLLGRWHCLTRTLDTMTLEFKTDGTGSAAYKLHGKTFTYFFDPRSRRVDMSDAQGDCELTPDGRLSADLRFSFVDVLQPGFPTITVDVKGAFTREKPAAKAAPRIGPAVRLATAGLPAAITGGGKDGSPAAGPPNPGLAGHPGGAGRGGAGRRSHGLRRRVGGNVAVVRPGSRQDQASRPGGRCSGLCLRCGQISSKFAS